MDIAIVTGASSSLGLAISRRLLQLGFRVYGLGGDYKDCSLQNVNFRPVQCDLADPEALETACRRILEKEQGIYLLVNNAKYFGQKPFDQMSSADMERILKVNLLCPLVLIRVFGESLRALQGYVIQLGAPYAESSNGGAAGAASAGGLKWMGEQLFNEYREYGVKISHLSPEPNRARDARMRLRPGARPAAAIDPEAIAQAVEQILQSPFGNVVTEMIIRPLRIDEPEHDPVWKIPYPDPQPIPYTVPKEVIEAEEQREEEEWQQQQLKRQQRGRNKSEEKPAGKKESPRQESPSGQASKEPPVTAEPPTESGETHGRTRKRSRRKPRPRRVVVGFHEAGAHDNKPVEKTAGPQPAKTEATSKQDTAVPAPASRDASEGTKKAVKKTARKQPAKKAAAKKAVKKAVKQGARKSAVKKPAKEAGKPAESS